MRRSRKTASSERRLVSSNPTHRNTLVITLIAVIVLCFVQGHYHGFVRTNIPLAKSLTINDAAELGDVAIGVNRDPPVSGNPWAGASRRRRTDLLVAQLGCGGAYRIASQQGDSLQLRYRVRRGGQIFESTRNRDPVDVVLGSHHVESDVEQALLGVCAGEVLHVKRTNNDDLLIGVIGIRRSGITIKQNEETDDVADQLTVALRPTPSRKGASCAVACARKGMRCNPKGFIILNSCPRLRSVFKCSSCEVAAAGTAGADMPCQVAENAPLGYSRGFCMVHPNVKYVTCEASHDHTRRLCPCFRVT